MLKRKKKKEENIVINMQNKDDHFCIYVLVSSTIQK